MAMFSSAVKSYDFGATLGGPIGGAIAAAAAIAAGTANIANIKNQPTGGNYATGGIVPGSSFSGDNVSANVNSGEMILNRQQQANLFQQANGRGGSGKITIVNQTSANIGDVQESTNAAGERQIIIREAVDIAKKELTDEVALGYGDFDSRLTGAFSLSRGG